jgi:glucose/arabinose dehydrogenase
MKYNYLFRGGVAFVFIVSLISFKAAFFGSGLSSPEPIGKFLNGAFDRIDDNSSFYTEVFKNLSFDSPLTFNSVPNQNRLVIGQRDGKVYWFDAIESISQKNLLIDLSQEVGVVWDGGFLGLAIHPDFGQNGNNYFFIYYTTKSVTNDNTLNSPLGFTCGLERFHGNYLVLQKFEVSPTDLSFVPGTLFTMFKLQMYNTTHRGGGMEFGDDGFLYLATGDQAAYKNAQDISDNLDGGVLRLDVDMDPSKSHAPIRKMPTHAGEPDEFSGQGYWIPNDNPFVNPNGGNFEEYFTLGHRNPHRMTKDKNSGIFFIGEIGESKHEEINIVKKGANYGWPYYEGNALGPSPGCVSQLYNNMPHEAPLTAFDRADANALIGGYVYRGMIIRVCMVSIFVQTMGMERKYGL